MFKSRIPAACLLVSILLSAGASAQSRLHQGFGLGYTRTDLSASATATKGAAYMNSDYSMNLHTLGITYLLRADLVSWTFGSISIGAPVTGGFSWSSRYRSTDFDGTNTYHYQDTLAGANWAFDIPVVADLNIGLHSAADETRRSFGLYVGAGYGYSFTKIRTSIGRRNYDGYQPVLRAGIRWGSAWERRWSLNFSVRGSLKTSGNNAYGLQLLKEL